MKNFDLDSEVKALRAPERDEEFWDTFPQRVLTELRSTPPPASIPRAAPSRLVWTTVWSLAGLAFCLCLGLTHTPRAVCFALIQDERNLRRSIQVFPDHVRTLMQDEHGLHQLVADQP